MGNELSKLTKSELVLEGQNRNPKVVLKMSMKKQEMIDKLNSTPKEQPKIARDGRYGEY